MNIRNSTIKAIKLLNPWYYAYMARFFGPRSSVFRPVNLGKIDNWHHYG
jgi:hypothetical protein